MSATRKRLGTFMRYQDLYSIFERARELADMEIDKLKEILESADNVGDDEEERTTRGAIIEGILIQKFYDLSDE